MNPLLAGLVALLSATTPLRAQIYADFTVSHGDSPLGTFRVRLEHEKAPRPVAAFVGLATGRRNWVDIRTGNVMTNTPYYDGQVFHRLDHDFVIQGGDPLGVGNGNPGYVIQDQYHPDLRHDGRYVLSMAKTSLPNTNGSQFFITLADPAVPAQLERVRNLDDLHSVFGEVINDAAHPDSRALIDNFANPALFPTTGESPVTPINLDSVVISGPSLASFDVHDPAHLLPVVRRAGYTPSYDGTNRFALTFPALAQRDYIISAAISLLDFTPFRYIVNLAENPGFEFGITGVDFDTFFAGLTEVDYSLVTNGPEELTGAGSTLTLSDHDGHTISMVFAGPETDTGTWSDSLGNSGLLSGVSWSDSVPATGNFINTFSQAHFIPLGVLEVTFDNPAGHRAVDSLSLTLSFHSPTSGQVESTGFLPDGKRFLQAFTYSP